jgi:hypothetical protein
LNLLENDFSENNDGARQTSRTVFTGSSDYDGLDLETRMKRLSRAISPRFTVGAESSQTLTVGEALRAAEPGIHFTDE